jgi:hypothetical protein
MCVACLRCGVLRCGRPLAAVPARAAAAPRRGAQRTQHAQRAQRVQARPAPLLGGDRAAGCPPQVLAGVRILFSRVIPLDQAPASHALWRMAEAFGAACTTTADAAVTHVVASTRGTEKVFWALQTHKHVVLPAWYALPAALARPPSPAALARAQPRPRVLHPLARNVFTRQTPRATQRRCRKCWRPAATALPAWYASQQRTVTTPSLAVPTSPNTVSSEQRLRQPAPGSPAKQELEVYKSWREAAGPCAKCSTRCSLYQYSCRCMEEAGVTPTAPRSTDDELCHTTGLFVQPTRL